MAATPDTVHWRGVHHLALVTPDMDATVRFWHGVLDARLVTTLATPAFKHYFFEVAPGNTVAFFQYLGQHLDTFAKPAGVPYERAAQFDHLSLHLPDEDALLRLRDRLKSHDCESPTSSTTASCGRSTSATTTASRSRPRGGHSTRPGVRSTTATSACSPTPIPSQRCASCATAVSSTTRSQRSSSTRSPATSTSQVPSGVSP